MIQRLVPSAIFRYHLFNPTTSDKRPFCRGKELKHGMH